MSYQILARIALAAYLLYSIAFHAEGYKPRGSVGLKTLGFSAETLMYAALIWAGFFS